MVYKKLIDQGVQTVMAGHIIFPAFEKEVNPQIADEDIMPATLSKVLLNDLLREKLGFNGLIVTDATPMIGFNVAERREISVPKSIASGCDMFLFNKNVKEDFEFMLKGIENGILTEDRVNEAVTRILATKASLGLHKAKKNNTLIKPEEELKVLKCKEHELWARECATKGVTLIKDTQNLLPISASTHKRVRLYILENGDNGGFKDGESAVYSFKAKLEALGFEVDLFDRKKLDFREVFNGSIK